MKLIRNITMERSYIGPHKMVYFDGNHYRIPPQMELIGYSPQGDVFCAWDREFEGVSQLIGKCTPGFIDHMEHMDISDVPIINPLPEPTNLIQTRILSALQQFSVELEFAQEYRIYHGLFENWDDKYKLPKCFFLINSAVTIEWNNINSTLIVSVDNKGNIKCTTHKKGGCYLVEQDDILDSIMPYAISSKSIFISKLKSLFKWIFTREKIS